MAIALGCEEGPRHGSAPAEPVLPAGAAAAPGVAPLAVAPPAATAAPAIAPTAPAASGAAPATPESAAPAPGAAETATQNAAENTEREKADVGSGQKGRSLNYELGTTSAKVYFAARERVVFEIQIPEAMKLYKASTGAAPKDHAAFMRDVIQANSISLPELPSGHKYVYDPQTEELQVEHPRGQ